MNLVPDEARLGRLIAGAPWYMLLGFSLIVFARMSDGIGAISAAFALYLGAGGACLRAWRTERGLWMLSGLMLAFSVVIVGLIASGNLIDILNNRRSPAWIALDALIASRFLWMSIRMFLGVTLLNYRVSLHHADADELTP